jgi:hypothetical protein
MYGKKNIFMLVLVSILVLAACQNDTSKSSHDEVLNDSSALSTDLVNNPTTDENQVVSLEQSGLLVFADTVHDFGKLTEGEVIQHEFEYVNKGSKEVIITNAKGSCGCTVPEYDYEPIPPGGTGVMKVTFDSKGKTGFNEKSVMITTNGVPSKYRLTILATVTK